MLVVASHQLLIAALPPPRTLPGATNFCISLVSLLKLTPSFFRIFSVIPEAIQLVVTVLLSLERVKAVLGILLPML